MSKNRNKNKNNVNNGMSTVNNGLSTALGLDYVSSINNNPSTIINNTYNGFLTFDWTTLSNTYKSNGFAKLAIDMPVSDAFRDNGFYFTSATLDVEELQDLNDIVIEQDLKEIKDCNRWSSLYGGGVLLLNSSQKPDVPLDYEKLYKKDLEFIATDRWQCTALGRSVQLTDKFLLTDGTGGKDTGIVFHKSRLSYLTGETQPWYIRNQLGGWGCSVFEHIIPQLSQYIKANSAILELIDECKIDILKIFGLSDLLLTGLDGEAKVRKRAEIFASEKNFQNMGVMDSQDDYVQKTLSFTGFEQMLEKIFLLICASLRIPYSKVFGKGASGFSSGEDDLENYNAMLSSSFRVPNNPLIKWVAKIRSYQLFGREIPDLKIEWKPLRVMTAEQEQAIKNNKINGYMQLVQNGIITRRQCAEKLVSDSIIDLSEEEINRIDDDYLNENFENEQVTDTETDII